MSIENTISFLGVGDIGRCQDLFSCGSREEVWLYHSIVVVIEIKLAEGPL
jgi:hypothetical protein